MSKNFLIVVDMQNDFVTGSLGSEAAQSIVGNVVKVLDKSKDYTSVFTLDTHIAPYAECSESDVVPIEHCVENTEGWQLIPAVARFVDTDSAVIRKNAFGITSWKTALYKAGYGADDVIGAEFIVCGLCTDICVVSNVITLRSDIPRAKIRVVTDACAGTSDAAHNAALLVMQSVGAELITTEDLK